MKELIRSVWDSQRPLLIAAALFAFSTVVFIVVAFADDTQILGINRWFKPIKFFQSAAIFTGTVAIYLYFLEGSGVSKKIIAWGVIAAMAIELALITMQAARGTTSHFNTSNPFDGAIFSVMGIVIGLNTLLILGLTIIYFLSDTELEPHIIWGMRLGLVVFLLGSIEGGYMSSQVGHSVGVADGGAGLPFVNWSTEGGDLRVAHFFGLHSLQAIPLFGLLTGYALGKTRTSTLVTILFGFLYAVGFSILFYQALNARPVL